MSELQITAPHIATVWASWRALLKALRGNALATFPREAFEDDIVVHRFLGHRQFIFNRPDAIRRILVENSGNYVRTAPTIRVLGPVFGRGLFLTEYRRGMEAPTENHGLGFCAARGAHPGAARRRRRKLAHR